jgi:hypothetical protein
MCFSANNFFYPTLAIKAFFGASGRFNPAPGLIPPSFWQFSANY